MNWKHGTIFLLYRHTFSENELTDFIVKWHQQFYTPISSPSSLRLSEKCEIWVSDELTSMTPAGGGASLAPIMS